MIAEIELRLLEAIAAGRLLILCGAGLSMAPPSSLPNAARIAAYCNDHNLSLTGSPLPNDIKDDLEKIARYFRACNRFESFFIARLVPWAEFKSDPNKGHFSIADFLNCRVIIAAVTTNFDSLVEKASKSLGEPDFRAIVEAGDIPQQTEYNPLVKIHGCEERNRQETIWCRDQLGDEPIATKMAVFKNWLKANLLGRDLMFVGFWTDLGYLTDVFASSLSDIMPGHVYLIDPESPDVLRQKAPELWDWAHKPGITFHHVRESGSDFLDDLRQVWSRVFLRRLIEASRSTYEKLFGGELSLTSFEAYDSGMLYALRRDLTGTPRNAPVRMAVPSDSDYIAAALHSHLLSLGASYSEHIYTYQNTRLRIISGKGRLLSIIQAAYQNEAPISPGEDIVICAGGLTDPSPVNIVRAEEPSSIIRKGSFNRWITLGDYLSRLGEVHE